MYFDVEVNALLTPEACSGVGAAVARPERYEGSASTSRPRPPPPVCLGAIAWGFTIVHFSAQPELFIVTDSTHRPVVSHTTVYVEPISGRV